MTTSNSSPNRKTALITGASVGIGYELAKLLARDSYDLILVSRDKDRLQSVAEELEESFQGRVAVLPKDLTIARAPDEIFEQLQQNSITLDVLVNNAGFGAQGAFHAGDTQQVLDMIQLMVTSLVHLTRLVLPGMIDRGSGKILNVASTAAFQPGPYMSIYYATKAFVLSFSEAVGTELRGTGVSVTTLCPGPTRTEFHARAGMKESRLASSGVVMDAQTVARLGYEAMMKNKLTVITGARNKLGAFLSKRVMPKSIVLRTVSALNKNR